MAGAEGLEPSTKVLETHVLPLHHAPSPAQRGYYTKIDSDCQGLIFCRKRFARLAVFRKGRGKQNLHEFQHDLHGSAHI